MNKMSWAYIVLVFVILGCAKSTQAQQPSNGADSTPKFNPRRVVSPRPAITNAPIIAAAEVKEQVTDNELVLGVVVNGEARAYPINMLTGPSREIINDTLGNRAIAATW